MSCQSKKIYYEEALHHQQYPTPSVLDRQPFMPTHLSCLLWWCKMYVLKCINEKWCSSFDLTINLVSNTGQNKQGRKTHCFVHRGQQNQCTSQVPNIIFPFELLQPGWFLLDGIVLVSQFMNERDLKKPLALDTVNQTTEIKGVYYACESDSPCFNDPSCNYSNLGLSVTTSLGCHQRGTAEWIRLE